MRSKPGWGTDGTIADTGRWVPASAGAGQRGARDGALVKKEAPS